MTTLAAEVSVSTGCTPNETTPVTSTGLGIRSVRGIGYLQVLDNKNNGGERGIRTPDTRKGIHAFEARAFSHSAISPRHNFIFILSGKLLASNLTRPISLH